MSFASRFSVGCAAACCGVAWLGIAAKHAARRTTATVLPNLFESLFIEHSPNAKIPDGFTPTARLRCGGVSWRLDGRRDVAVSQMGGAHDNLSRPVSAALTFERWKRRIRGFGRRYSPQLKCAIRAVFVVFGDFLLALRAGRMQVALAVGAVVEARADHLAALRTRIRERLPHQEVKNEADRKIRRREDDNEKG